MLYPVVRVVYILVASISSGFIPASGTARVNLFEILTLPNQLSIWTPNVIEVESDDEEEEA